MILIRPIVTESLDSFAAEAVVSAVRAWCSPRSSILLQSLEGYLGLLSRMECTWPDGRTRRPILLTQASKKGRD